MSPDGEVAMPVFMVDAPRTLGFGGPFDASTPWRASWVMHLEPVGDGATRLIVRLRAAYEPGLLNMLGQALLEPIHFVMERKMLLELRRKVPRPGAEQLDPPAGLHARR